MPVEIEFTGEGQVRGNFQVAGSAKNRVMEVDVVLLDRFVALVQCLMLSTFLGCEFPCRDCSDIFSVRDDAE